MSAPEIDVWYGNRQCFGGSCAPASVIHVLGRVTSSQPLHVLSYSLGGGRLFPVSIGPDGFRLLRAGDFNIELDRRRLQPGTNELRIFATDQAGNEQVEHVQLELDPHSTITLPTAIDFATLECHRDQDATLLEIVDGRWRKSKHGWSIEEPGYDRTVAIGCLDWQNYDAVVELTFEGLDESPTSQVWPSMQPELGLRVYWQGHYDWGDIRPHRGWFPMAADGGLSFNAGSHPENRQAETLRAKIQCRTVPNERPTFAQEPISMVVGQRYRIRMRVSSGPGQLNRYGVKIWNSQSLEPSAWHLAQTGNQDELKCGSLLVNAHHVKITLNSMAIQEFPHSDVLQ